MADIKGISGNDLKINDLQQNDLNNNLDRARNGNFQGASVNSVQPPDESPFAGGQKQMSASRIAPPQESPIAGKESQTGYSISNAATPVNNLANSNDPSNERLVDFALEKKGDAGVEKFLEKDAAASRAVADLQRGLKEIGSLDQEPQLDSKTLQRLDKIAEKLFRS